MPCRGSRRESRATRFCARPRILERVLSSPGRSACGTGICHRRRASMVVLLGLRAELAAERGEILAQAFHRVTGGDAAKQQQQHACPQQAASQGVHHRGPLDRHGVDPAAACAREVNAARRLAGRPERKLIGTGPNSRPAEGPHGNRAADQRDCPLQVNEPWSLDPLLHQIFCHRAPPDICLFIFILGDPSTSAGRRQLPLRARPPRVPKKRQSRPPGGA
jgi:hypothetical protein